MTERQITIAGRAIGPDHPPYLIAELGINHGGDPALAREMLLAAIEAGADAIKLQSYQTARFLARSSDYYDVLHDAELPSAAIEELIGLASEKGAVLFSAVFDEPSADLLASLGAPAFKIASGDLTHLPLLAHVSAVGRPMIVSTGGATMQEIETALAAIREARADTPVALLHCISNYPTAPEDTNLACMATMEAAFGLPVGFSDHTLGNTAPIAAVALGARIIEKHFTLDRTAPGPDHQLSADPAMLAELAEALAAAHATVGRAEKAPVEAADFIPQIRRSVTAHVAIPAGATITGEMLEIKRPGTGIAPADLARVIGRTAVAEIAADAQIEWAMLAE